MLLACVVIFIFAPLVCVLHQLVHLMMDGYLVERLKKA